MTVWPKQTDVKCLSNVICRFVFITVLIHITYGLNDGGDERRIKTVLIISVKMFHFVIFLLL